MLSLPMRNFSRASDVSDRYIVLMQGTHKITDIHPQQARDLLGRIL